MRWPSSRCWKAAGCSASSWLYYDRPHVVHARRDRPRRSPSPGMLGFSVERVQRRRARRSSSRPSSNPRTTPSSARISTASSTWNRGAERLFGYTAEEAIGKPVTMLIPPDRLDEEPGILARIRSGERVDHYETIRRRKDGSLVDISLTVSPIRDATGRIVGASKIARDITDAEAAEAKLRDERAPPAGTARRHSGRDLHDRRRRQDHLFQPGGGRARRPHARRSAATNGA